MNYKCMNKILCTGDALIDMICTDRGKPLKDGENFLKKPGGAPANVAAAIGALGGNVALASKVGIDPFGTHLCEVLQSFNVDTKYVLQTKDYFTTFAFVSLMENGERDFYFNRGAEAQLNQQDVSLINLDEISIAHFGSATAFLPAPLQSAYTSLLDAALKKNCFISFDPNYRELLYSNEKPAYVKQVIHFIRNCNFFKVSDEEALLISNTSTLEEAAAYFFSVSKAVFTITLGKDGTMLGLNNQTFIIPSIPVNPVDTTGAGDAFVGAVLYQLSNKSIAEIKTLDAAQWKQIILNANKAGARTCEYMGAMEAFKHLSSDIFK